jgi:hypothetical protein
MKHILVVSISLLMFSHSSWSAETLIQDAFEMEAERIREGELPGGWKIFTRTPGWSAGILPRPWRDPESKPSLVIDSLGEADSNDEAVAIPGWLFLGQEMPPITKEGLLTWSFSVRASNISPSEGMGVGSSQFPGAAAVILAADNAMLDEEGSGVALAILPGREIALIAFTNGLRGEHTLLAVLEESDLERQSIADFFHFEIQYQTQSGQWTIRARNDGPERFEEHEALSLSRMGTGANQKLEPSMRWTGFYCQSDSRSLLTIDTFQVTFEDKP